MIIKPLRGADPGAAWLAVRWLKDAQGRILQANQAYAELLGKNLAEIIGKAEDAIFPPEIRAGMEESRDYLRKCRLSQIRREIVPLEMFGDGRCNIEMNGIREPIFDDRNLIAYAGMAVSLLPVTVSKGKIIRIDEWLQDRHARIGPSTPR